jgi:hypothetical protein
VATAAEQLASLFKGNESWAYWLWKFPCVLERLRPVSAAVAAFPWNFPTLDLYRDSQLVRHLLEQPGPTNASQATKVKMPAEAVEVWEYFFLDGDPSNKPNDIYKAFKSFKQSQDDIAKTKARVAELARIEFPSIWDGHVDPIYRPTDPKKPIFTGDEINILAKQYRQWQRNVEYDKSRAALKGLQNEWLAQQALSAFGDAATLLKRAKQAFSKAEFDLILEEAHVGAAHAVIPELYAIAWKHKSAKAFPGMPSGWNAAIAKAEALYASPDEKSIESWITDIARAAAKEKVAPMPIFNLFSVRPPYRVRYPRDWWDGDKWPKNWPSDKVQKGDGPSDGYDVRKPLVQQNLDELEPEFGDYLFKIAFTVVVSIMAGGAASALLAETGLGAALGEGLVGDVVGASLEGAANQGITNLAGGNGDIGQAALGAAGSFLGSDPMGFGQDFLSNFSSSLGDNFSGLTDLLGDVGSFAKETNDAIEALGNLFDGGDKKKPKPIGNSTPLVPSGGVSLPVPDNDPDPATVKPPKSSSSSWGPLLAAAVILFVVLK